MVEIKAVNLPRKLRAIAMKAALRITETEAIRVIPITPVFSPVSYTHLFGNDKDNKLQEANFETNHPAIKNFFGPAGNNVVHNANGAYATGDAFYLSLIHI